ncbi:pimeloyl-ACP methyl ester carboxylesterase [Bacillus ectoiniformans]|uniref:alpha/beta fold hydrolase n=1 Tax=Bacillus ectoiniformans TaxID=1494429 RepID=UPI00195A7719|nr:alpha/beta hydrolase [Bacillus ectoiniformans]MBM7649127.1 pimeloyl-ACP methyl ester carboxylesterase [Bacillus ectoiniformans]
MEVKHNNAIKPFIKLKLVGITLIIIILLTLVLGFLFEYTSYKNVKSNYPPDGEMIDVGSREIHINIKGNKTSLPPVLIETGTGNWSYDWSNIQEELSKHTLVITYDRAGYGWSDPPTSGFDIDMTINDLNNILESSNIDTPVILVGHSVGGIYSRLFADKYPDKISGMVLVDSRNEYFLEQAKTYNERFFETQDQKMNQFLSQIGIVRLFGENIYPDAMPEYLSPEKYVNVHWDPPFFKVLDEEIKQIKVSEKLLEDTQSLGDKPLSIITPSEVELQAKELGFSEQEARNLENNWMDSQKKLTDLSTNSEFILVNNSSHSVMYDQPNIIINAILKMAEEI